ncbi:hypothetical protein Hanom_Chr02g00114901 [Helianthus anomalus]
MVELFSRCVRDNNSIQISSPTMLYPLTVRDSIPYVERGYIIDFISREKDQHSYLLTSVIDEAFGFPFLWNTVNFWNKKGCLPQKEIDKLILDLTPQIISRVFPTG